VLTWTRLVEPPKEDLPEQAIGCWMRAFSRKSRSVRALWGSAPAAVLTRTDLFGSGWKSGPVRIAWAKALCAAVFVAA